MVTRVKNSVLYIRFYPQIPVTQECRVPAWGLVGCLDSYQSKSIWSLFFPLYGSLACCLHHLNTETSKWFTTGKQNSFLGACSWFHFCWTSWPLDSSKTQLFGICIGQLFTFCSNAWFFLMNVNKGVMGTHSLLGHLLSNWVLNNILHCSWIETFHVLVIEQLKHAEKLLLFGNHTILWQKCCPLQSFSLLGWLVDDCLYLVRPVMLSSGF